MLKKYNFFDGGLNKSGNFKNDFKDNGDGTITDHATGLMWQKFGSDNPLYFKGTQRYIQELNRKKFAGYNDWRLPTTEELASLQEPERQSNDLHINPVFDNKQRWCWSADRIASKDAWWFLDFEDGPTRRRNFYINYVRAVRSGTDIDYFKRGKDYLDSNQYQRAIEDYTQFIRFNPNSAESYLNRGIAYFRLNKYEQAIEDGEYDSSLLLYHHPVGSHFIILSLYKNTCE